MRILRGNRTNGRIGTKYGDDCMRGGIEKKKVCGKMKGGGVVTGE